jgi:hypothetical protein
MRKGAQALGIGLAAAVLALATGGAAEAQAGFTNGPYLSATSVSFVGCSGKLQEGYNADGAVYARGWFTLPRSERNLPCIGKLQRSTDGGASWHQIGDDHVPDLTGGPTTQGTYYYYDDGPAYRARVCVGDWLHDNSYSCGGAF